jgi:hypothetical protein
MRKIFIFFLGAFALFQGNALAQAGLNNITVATNSDGNISWNANVDGHHRKGYFDQSMLDNVCSEENADKDVLVPVTSNLYPTPSTDMLFFSGTGYDHFTITIKDVNGKLMITEKYFDKTSMDISSFNNGTYTIEIVAEKTGQVFTKKLIKE